ncbi:proteasome complex subunit Rpn13 ubiquitin receptor-domain-containing protein [Pilobolus umbonatus]|nr:proteasome complex subunit Rpn13 ubiquitin receptor-domain-containing protein [Pilobolus umbonatus]
MSLFAAAPEENHLIEFNAGKCIVEGSWIKPDTRKGKIIMDQGDDQFLHFYWKERGNQAVCEDDFIIFPEEAEFSLVSQCTTGRVYVLKFKTSNDRHFYWMQSTNVDKDQEIADRMNKLISESDNSMNMYSEMDESSSHAEFMRLLSSVENQGTP